MLKPAVVALAGLAVLSLAPDAVNARAGEDLCARFGAPAEGGTVANGALTEISGLAGSRAHPGVLWTHNDSGGEPALYAMADDGTDLGAYVVEGAEAVDWEDMAVGPGPDPERSYLYAADIGDNDAVRASVTVYRVPEPSVAPDGSGGTLAGAQAIEVRYPEGPADAEALLVDPITGDLFVVTKSYAGRSSVLQAPSVALDAEVVIMSDVGTVAVRSPADAPVGLPGTAVTGGDVSPDGSIILLRTYRSVLAFGRGEGETVADALVTGTACFAPQVEEAQGEAVAFTGDGTAYVTASEGVAVPITRFELATPATTTSTTSSTTTVTATRGGEAAAGGADDGSSRAPIVVVGAGLLLALGAGALVWSRRGRASAR